MVKITGTENEIFWDEIPSEEFDDIEFKGDTAMIIKIITPSGDIFPLGKQVTLELPFALMTKEIADALSAKYKFKMARHRKRDSIRRRFESALVHYCARGQAPTPLLEELEKNREKMGRRTYFYIKKMIKSACNNYKESPNNSLSKIKVAGADEPW